MGIIHNNGKIIMKFAISTDTPMRVVLLKCTQPKYENYMPIFKIQIYDVSLSQFV